MTFRHALIAVTSALLWAGCTVDSSPNSAYRCQSDQDCLKGERCLEQLCRSAASLQGGAPSAFTCDTRCSDARKLCCMSGCVDPATDRTNCGACGNVCGAGLACRAGQCVAEVCNNGLDDNNDGKVDCQDISGCPDKTACRTGQCCRGECAREASVDLCTNGIDDDCDGLKDCADPKCTGQACGQGKVCGAERTCTEGCFIGGVFYFPGDANPKSPCFACRPTVKTNDWSLVVANTPSGSCKDSLMCDGSGRCRRAIGQVCAQDSDCASASCSQSGVCAP